MSKLQVVAVARRELLLLRGQPRLLLINGVVALVIAAVVPLSHLSASAAPDAVFIAHVRRLLPVIPLFLVWGLSAGSIWGSRARGEWTIVRLAPLGFLEVWLGMVFTVASTALLLAAVGWATYLIGALLLGIDAVGSLAIEDVILFGAVTPLAVVALAGWAVLLFLTSRHPRAGNAVFAVVIVTTVFAGGVPSGSAALVVLLGAAAFLLIGAVVIADRLHVHRHIAP